MCAFALGGATKVSAQSWVQETNFGNGGTARYAAYSFSIGAIGYMGGGSDGPILNDFWGYDPNTNSWTQEGSLPSGYARQIAASFAIGDTGYVCTGYGNNGYLGDLWAYVPASNAWVAQANFPGQARYGACGFAINGKGYVGTGVYGGQYFNDLYQFTPAPNSIGTWATMASFGTVSDQREGCASFSIGNYGYIGLGANASSMFSSFYRFNPDSNTWVQVANFAGVARNYPACFSINGQGYVGTGNNINSLSQADFWSYNPVGDSWSQIADYGGGLRWVSAAFSIGSTGYVGTGQDRNTGQYENDFWAYNTCVPNQPNPITGSASVCSGSQLTYSISPVPNATSYTWTLPNGWSGASTDTIIFVQTNSTGGQITVTANDSCGSSVAQVLNVSVYSNLSGWSQKASYGGTDRESSAYFAIGSKGYIGCGREISTLTLFSDFWSYDPTTDSWTQEATYLGGARYGVSSFAIGDYGYVGLGYNNSTYPTDFWKYDPVANSWSQVSSFGGSGRYTAASFVIGSNGYVGTGYNGGLFQDLWQYNSITDNWTQVANFPAAARQGAVGFAIGNYGYMGTGYDGSSTNDFYKYDPSANSWTSISNLPNTAIAASSFVINNLGYVGLGQLTSASNLTNHWSSYNPVTNTWSSVPNFGGSARFNAASFAINGIGYAGTGTINNNLNSSTDFWEFNTCIAPATPGTISGPFSACLGSIQTYSVTPVTGANSYNWTLPNGWTGTSTTNSIVVTVGNNGGLISVSATNCCGTSQTQFTQVSVTDSLPGQPGQITGNISICASSIQTYSVNPVPNATSYTWTLPNGWSGSSTTNSINVSASSSSGNISVRANNACGSSLSQILSVSVSASNNGWTQQASIGGLGRRSAVGFAAGGKGYIGLGYNDNSSSILNDFWQYDPNTNAWTQIANYGGTPRFGGVAFVCNDIGYVGLGSQTYPSYSFVNDFWKYDVNSNTWIQTANFTGSGRVNAAAFSISSNGYIGCGYPVSNDFWQYDAVADTWTQRTNFPGAPRQGPVGFNIGNYGYMGCGTSSSPYSDFYKYNPDSNSWGVVANLPSVDISPVSFVLGNKAYVGTGSLTNSLSLINHWWAYNSLTNSWTQVADQGTTPRLAAVGFAIGNYGYCGAGFSYTNSVINCLSDFWQFNSCEAPPTPGTISGPNSICQPSIQTYSISPVSGASSYNWTLPNGWSGTSTTNSITVNTDSLGGMISVTAVNCCGVSQPQTLQVNFGTPPAQPGPITGDSNICAGVFTSYSIAPVPGATSYTWTLPNGWTGSSIVDSISVHTSSSGGTISVMANNSCGSSPAQSLLASIVSITPTITPNGPTNFCPGGSVTLDAGIYLSYFWSTGATTHSITVTSGGNYSVSVVDNSGCTGVASQSITINATPTPSISANGPTSFCSGDSVALDAGVFDSYNWSNGSSSEFITVATTGNYTVTVTNTFGCTGSASQLVTANQQPTPTILASGLTTFCDGGSVSLIAGNWQSYLWNTGATTDSISVSTTGAYRVTITDINGCSGIASQTVTVYNNPTPNITGNTSFCAGNFSTLDPGTYFSYIWSTGATSETIDVYTSGTFSVTVTDYLGCTGIASQTVTVNSIASDSITANGPTSFCQGGSVTLFAGSYTSYSWSTGSTATHITVNTSDTYSVTVSNASGCTSTGSIVVTVNPNVTPVITPSGPTDFCQGGSVDLDAGVYDSYHWSNGATTESITITTTGTFRVTVSSNAGCTGTVQQSVNVFFNPTPTITANGPTSICQGNSVILDAGLYASYIWNTGSTDETVSASTADTFIVTVTNNNGCTASASQAITVNAIPSPTITANGPTTFCQGGSVMLNAGNFFTYMWSNNATTETITASTSGQYSVTVSFVNGCTGMASQSVTENTNPNPTITPSGLTTFCNGGSVNLDAGIWVSYLWNNGATSESITVSSTGNYMVTVTDVNGCNGNAAQMVTVSSNPTPSITGSTSICSGNFTTLSAGSFASYNWSTGATTSSISVSSAGSYSVTVTDINGCSGMTSRSVTVNSLPTPTVTPNGPTTFCAGGSVLLNAGSYASYMWNTGSTTMTISANTNGNFMVTVTDVNGCTGMASQAVTVNSNPVVAISPSGPTTFCQGDSVMLNAGNYVSYNWNTGSTTQSITVYGSQPYCVTVTNSNGCTGNSCQFVQVFAQPTPSITPSGPTTFCSGHSVTLSAGTFVTYLWNTGATTATLNATTTGIYTVTVANVNNCTGSASISVTALPSPAPVISANGPTNFCQGGSVTLDAGTFVSYHWMNSQTTESIFVLASGNYVVTVTGNNGCTGSGTQTVTVTQFIPPVITANGPTQFCSGGSVSLDAGVYNTYTWSNGATTETVTTSISGLYVVTVSNGGNCTGVANRAVTANSSPVPVILVTNQNNLCGGGYAHLTVGAVFPVYSWSNGFNTQLDTVNAAGTYTVTVTNTNLCTGTASTTITGSCSIPAFPVTPTTNIAATSAMANWVQPTCHISYNVRISVHNANVWTVHNIAPNNHYTFSGLLHNTAYDWQIQTNCDANQINVSGYSASQTFTTLPRLEGDESASSLTSFNVYPNPASVLLNVVFSSDNEENYNLHLIDVMGRLIVNESHVSTIGDNQNQLNLDGIAKGVYVLIIQKGESTMQKRIVVE